MADNQQTTNSPAAAQASATPAQPSTTRQPAGQTAQGTAAPYAQYPNAYGQTYHSYQQYGYNPYGGAYGQGMYPQAGPQSPVPEGKLWIYTKTGLHGLAVVVAICSLGMGLSLIPGENGYLARIACPLVSPPPRSSIPMSHL